MGRLDLGVLDIFWLVFVPLGGGGFTEKKRWGDYWMLRYNTIQDKTYDTRRAHSSFLPSRAFWKMILSHQPCHQNKPKILYPGDIM